MKTKNKKILVFSVLIGIVISFVGTSLNYLGDQLKSRIIFMISVIFLSFSSFLFINLAWYIEYYIWGGLFTSTFNILLFMFLTSFIIWTFFIYLVCKLYNLWKIKKNKIYLFLMILLVIVFVMISLFGFIIALAMEAESRGW